MRKPQLKLADRFVKLKISKHAKQRMAELEITLAQIQQCLDESTSTPARNGNQRFHLNPHDVYRFGMPLELASLTVIVDVENEKVVTVYLQEPGVGL